MPPVAITVDAILFDMDGTLIDSTPGVYKAWKTFAADYSLGDYREVTHATHGRRLYDTLKELCKIEDEAKLLSEIDRFEDAVIEGGPTALPGAEELVSKVRQFHSAKCLEGFTSHSWFPWTKPNGRSSHRPPTNTLLELL
ncbi:hypothetical protein NP233_g8736 [Leucocoprinus birnbaumii]|uniref:Uncharacterized protein n=1 Tax=Leucocoprinus birnbaumii TaxID=56174 RepID=A0AAD5VQ92_9AGAR|nr:hypothetical protein NP233_g8736 [Leucocoprinus birnbaumii]